MKSRVIRTTPAGDAHQVVSVTTDGKRCYRRQPCSDCPWRRDTVGEFPAEAFRISATTAYDMATNVFSCHQSGTEKPAACAGFLLRGAEHNLSIRLAMVRGDIKPDVSDGGHELFDSYREMAVANGVSPEDPALLPTR